MPAKRDCSSLVLPGSPTSNLPTPRVPANAFSQSFLHQVRRLPEPSGGSPASLAGPWDVEPVAAGSQRFHAVVRRDEPVAEGGAAAALMLDRPTALQLAAALGALAGPCDVHMGEPRKRRGVTLHDGRVFLGHLARPRPELLPLFHAVRALAAEPDALALVLESLGPEGLALLGRVLARRLEKVG
jgi:hypothetical protein